MARRRHGHPDSSAAHHAARREGDCDDARYLAHATGERRQKCLLLRGGVTGKRRVGGKRHHVVAIEAGVKAMQLLEGAHQQTRASDQERAERDLKDDDRLPAAPAATGARAPQRAVYARARDGECECGSGQAAAVSAEMANGKQKDAPVEPKVHGEREASRDDIPERRQHPHHRAGQGKGKQHTPGGAESRQEETLREHLPHQPSSCGSNRQPDGDFLAPARNPRQQEPSHVGTDHQQQQTNGDEQ